MLNDRYGLAVSTRSSAALDAYDQGRQLMLTLYPGASDAFDRAIEADPGFALAHVAQARAKQLAADPSAALDAMAAARALTSGLSEREASHVAFFRLILARQSERAYAALRTHLDRWPRDAMVLSTSVSPSGLIGASGRVGQKQEQLALMDSLAPHYGDDWWFGCYHAFALIETGQCDAARPKLEWSMAANPRNAWAAHTQAHLLYEDGTPEAARAFMTGWLPSYSRQGSIHGHLCWHVALGELAAGNTTEAFRLYADSIAPDVHGGPAITALNDSTSFLWRSELAGNPRDPERWRATHDFARQMFPRAAVAFADWHVALTDAVAGDGVSLDARLRQMEDLARDGRYPSGAVVPALARAFAAFQRGDFTSVIEAIEPVLDQHERIGGSLAQTDLVAFTLLKTYLNSGRLDDARGLLARRRAGPGRSAGTVPVAGVAALH